MTRPSALTFCLFLMVATMGCGADDTPEPDAAAERGADSASDDDANDPASAIAGALNQAFGGEGGGVETVDFRTLRDMLPVELDDMERVEASGERAGVAGFSFSQAEGEYRSDDGERRISLQIVDGGGLAQMTMLGAAWMQVEVDREDDNGYERTTDHEGYPAYEKERSGPSPRSELSVVVAERFLVTANGQNVRMDELKDAVGDLDLGDLEDLRDEGIEE